MNVEKSLIELLLNEELDLEAFRAHPFVQSLRRALIVKKMSDRELIRRLQDVLYWTLVSRWTFLELQDARRGVRDPIREKALENANHKAFEKALACEVKLVGVDADTLFIPLRRGVRDTFQDSRSAHSAIRRIEKAKGSNPKTPSRSSTKGRKAGRKCCDAA